jgi:hypothetical protein
MAPPTQFDVRSESSASRNRSKHSFRPAARASSGATNTAESPTPKATFGDDFILEHTRRSVQVTLAKVSGNSTNTFNSFQESPQSYGFPC